MNKFINLMTITTRVEDPRQKKKVKYPIDEVIGLVLFSSLGNCNEWTEMEVFCNSHKECLEKYFELKNGIPSHDTFQRVMGMIDPKVIQQLQIQWNEYLNTKDGEGIKRILNIDGKTMRGSRTKDKNPLHVVSAWCDEEGFCLGQTTVKEKQNEIVAIPELLDTLNIKGMVVTIDAMGTQVDIAKKIVSKKADYVLAVKGNQGTLHQDLIDYFKEEKFLNDIKINGNYKKTTEKSHGQIETREYYQTSDIAWIDNKSRWKNIKTIGIVEKTINKENKISKEIRYYISSLNIDIELFSRSIRQHWKVEVMHWHLDVTFREDSNKTIEATANKNMNIIRKWALGILKILDTGKKMSMKLKRFAICTNPIK
ncbi:ISAs1 family transposase, partial [Cetobacterium sp.]|uniref:ISAs1 family transposase n=1 Tax=Cetobacterium sp. TaxID=2071632 RepID=UPI002FC878B9